MNFITYFFTFPRGLIGNKIRTFQPSMWHSNNIKSILETRPVYHQKDENIRGHVFCSFLALVLRKELESPLERYGYCFEWADIKQDLKALQYPLPFESYNLCQRANGSAKNFFGYVMCLISLNYFFATVQDQLN